MGSKRSCDDGRTHARTRLFVASHLPTCCKSHKARRRRESVSVGVKLVLRLIISHHERSNQFSCRIGVLQRGEEAWVSNERERATAEALHTVSPCRICTALYRRPTKISFSHHMRFPMLLACPLLGLHSIMREPTWKWHSLRKSWCRPQDSSQWTTLPLPFWTRLPLSLLLLLLSAM